MITKEVKLTEPYNHSTLEVKYSYEETPRKYNHGVCQLEDGQVIGTYKSLDDMQAATGSNKGNVSSCCNGSLEQANGYQWQHLDDIMYEFFSKIEKMAADLTGRTDPQQA